MAHNLVSVGVYLIEFFVAYLYLNAIFERKRSKVAVILIGLGIYALSLIQYLFLYLFALNVTVGVLRCLLLVFLCYRAKPFKSILASITLEGVLNLTEWIAIVATTAVTDGDINQYLTSLPVYIVIVVLAKTLYLLCATLLARFVFSRDRDPLSRTPAFLFLFPLCALFADVTLWKAVTEAPSIRPFVAVGSVAILAAVLLTYVFYGNTVRRNEELFRLQSAFEKAQTDKEYYALLESRGEELRTFVHDEKNRLAVLQSMDDADEMHQYVTQILGTLQTAAPVGNTQNKMLDLVLGKYDAQCRMLGVRFNYTAMNANLSFMEDVDLVALLGNVLDNAVEAAQAADDKWIELSIESKVAGVTILTCKNSAQNAPLTRGGLLRTTKENAAHHGIGVKSIARIAKKYDGQYKWSWDNQANVFIARIIFER